MHTQKLCLYYMIKYKHIASSPTYSMPSVGSVASPYNTIEWLRPHIEKIMDCRGKWKSFIVEKTEMKYERCHIGQSIYETIPPEIKEEVNTFTSNPVKYKLEIPVGGGEGTQQPFYCTVYICFPITQRPQVYASIIEKIACWLNLAVLFSGKGCAQSSLTVYLFMTARKKEADMENRGVVLDRIHVNSGQSNGCSHLSEIAVYRKEEWFKVFVHETCHSLGLSFQEGLEEQLNEGVHAILKGINPDQNINLFETHCEIIATLFNTVFSVLWKSGGSGGGTAIENRIAECLEKEQRFSLYQLEKIINRYCDKNIRCFYEKGLDWKENTNIFAYYFAKTLVLCNIHEFLKLLQEKNGESFSLWEWNTPKYIQKYIDFVFISSFPVFQQKYEQTKHLFPKWKQNATLKNTMRMTSVEFAGGGGGRKGRGGNTRHLQRHIRHYKSRRNQYKK